MEKAYELAKRLEKHPHMIARFEALLDVAENTYGSLENANEAEYKLAEEIQNTAKELLVTWAMNQSEKKSEEIINEKRVSKHSKKNSIGKQHSDK